MRSLGVVLSWMTVLPVGPRGVPDRRLAGRALTWLPAVGLVCGLVAVVVGHGATALGAAPLLAATLAVIALHLLTRGMHVDAVADTADALGSYAPSNRALEIMRSPTVGPMGAAAVVLVLLTEVAALAQLLDAQAWTAPVAALVLSRCAPVVLCRRGARSASEGGFGALVAGSQGPVPIVGIVFVAGTAGAGLTTIALPGPPVALAVGGGIGIAILGVVIAAGSHAARRVGGVTGDVLGAAIEVAAAVSLTAAALLV